MPIELASSHSHADRGHDRNRAEIAAFIADLVRAGIRPAEHFAPDASGRAHSVSLVGWSVQGCRGTRRGCGPDCTTVVTTGGRIAATHDQPSRLRWRRTRPTYLDLQDPRNLQALLALGRSVLLPRAMSA
ncbi:hypothetical protein [Nocardia jejuensis]|uniref:hypothetical protein n=1 Tax=Nocardia jejuensis TaxID=328049 RepID=UPI00082CC570|nr:hypothetical protein [Nocardia jejuensis]